MAPNTLLFIVNRTATLGEFARKKAPYEQTLHEEEEEEEERYVSR